MSDNSRRMLDFHIERATESLDAAGAYKIEVDRLMRYSGWHLLGTARMGDDPTTSVLDRWNRTHDVPNLYVVDGSLLRHLVGRQPDLDDRARSPCGPRTTWSRPASSSRCRHDAPSRPIRSRPIDADRRATLAAVADQLIPAAHGMPSAGEVVGDERLRFVLNARPDLAEPLRGGAARRSSATTRRRASTPSSRDEPADLGALQLVIVGRLLHGPRRPRAASATRARWR